MGKFTFLRAIFSPFKLFRLRFYIGKIAIGTPYFYPRRWTKNPKKSGYLTATPKKIGFDFVSLGWKTKWDSYRFEWSPIWSFVFFKWQIAIIFKAPYLDHYWESWLYYYFETDKKKSRKERIAQCREEAPQVWSTSKNGVKEITDYYDKILKKKYLK